MKKIISLAIIFCMLFSVTGSAFTVVKHTYNDVDGTIYHIGTFEEGDTDAGVIVNGKKYSLKSGIYMGDSANAWEEANGKQRRFALGLRTPAGFEGESYSVAPYSVDAEGELKVGQETAVYLGGAPDYVIEKTIENPVVADVKNGDNTDVNVSTNNIKQLTIKCDANAIGVSTHNQVLLAKLDISELKKDYVPGTDIYFTLNGGYAGNWATTGIDNSLSEMTIHVVGAPQVSQEWDEENAPAFVKEDGVTAKSYYNEFGMYGIPVDSIVVSTADSNKNVMEDRTFNITGFIQQELAKGNDYASIAIWVDNKAAEAANAETGGRNAYLFKILSRESGSPYKLTYTAVDTNVELKSLKVNEEEVTEYIDGNTYTKYLPYGTTEIPVVSAEAVSENAVVSVTQADSANGKATVKISSGDGKVSQEYYVQMVEAAFSSEAVSAGLYDNAELLLGSIHNPRVSDKNAETANVSANGKLELFASYADARFVHSAVIIKLDLEDIADSMDLSSDIYLNLNKHKFGYDVTEKSPLNTTADLALYDATELVDWSTAAGGTYCQQLVPVLEATEPIDKKTLPTNLGAESTTPVSFNISEFVRNAVKEGNLTPTFAFVLDHSFEPVAQNRIQMDFYVATNASEQMTISYNKYAGGASVSDASIKSLAIGDSEVDLQYVTGDVYTKYLPYGTTEAPVVSITSNPAATVEITQAESAKGSAYVKVTSYDKKTVNELEVKFVSAPVESVDKSIEVSYKGSAETAFVNMYSATEQSSAAVKPLTEGYTNSFNNAINTSGYTPIVSYMQLDFSALKNADFSSPVILNADSRVSLYDRATTGTSFGSVNVRFYDASDFDWENTDLTTRTALEDLTVINGKKLVAAFNGSTLTESSTTLATGIIPLDITEYAQWCIENENYTPTLCIYLEKPVNTVRDRALYGFRFGSSYDSSITWKNMDDIEKAKDTSLHSLTVDGKEIDLKYIDATTNTYTAYLPYDAYMAPWVDATSGEYSKVDVELAIDISEQTVITVTAATGDTETYYVKHTVAAAESAQTYKALVGDSPVIANNAGNIVSVTSCTDANGKEYIYTSGIAANIADIAQAQLYFSLYNAKVGQSNYKPNVALMQLDLNCLVNENADLSKPVELHMDGVVSEWDGQPSGGSKISIFDVSGYDWSEMNGYLTDIRAYDAADEASVAKATSAATEVKAILRAPESIISGKNEITSKFLANGKYGTTATSGTEKNAYGTIYTLEDNGFAIFDISEFVRYCISTGNMTPTLAFYLNPGELTVKDRLFADFYLFHTHQMSFIGYSK